MPEQWRRRVRDMLSRVDRIQRTLEGIDFEYFIADDDKFSGVMAHFMILGEAAHAVPMDVQERYPTIPWAGMWNMRNRLIHGYAEVDPEVVWETAVRDLPPLGPLLRGLLEEEAGS